MIYDLKDFAAVMSCIRKPLKWRLRLMASMSESNHSDERRQRLQVKRTRKPRAFLRNRGFAIDEMDNLSPVNFQRMFRLDRSSFYELRDMLVRSLTFDSVKATASSGSSISTTTRLAVTLRWLAGASYLDLCFAWGISKAVFYSERGVLWPTIEALDSLIHLGIDLENEESLST